MESKSVDPKPEAAAIERLAQRVASEYGMGQGEPGDTVHEGSLVWALTEAYSLGISQRETAFVCRARTSNMGANDPQECDWPSCGCDPYADKVIAALEESGVFRREFERGISQERERCAKIADSKICPSAVLAELYSRKSPLCSTPLPDMSDAVAKTLVYVAAAIRNPDPTEGQ